MFSLNLGHGWRVEGPPNEEGKVDNLAVYVEEEFIGVTITTKSGEFLEAIDHNPQLHGFILGLVAAKHMFFSRSEVLGQYCTTRDPDNGDFDQHMMYPKDVSDEVLEDIGAKFGDTGWRSPPL